MNSNSILELTYKNLVKKLKTISEDLQKVYILKETLGSLNYLEIAHLLEIILQRGYINRDVEILIPLLYLMEDSSFIQIKHILKTIAIEENLNDLGMLLQDIEPVLEAPQELKVPNYGIGRPLTLGERKAIARKPSRDILPKVLQDPDPSVIKNLLNNPKLTQQDVVRLCATRPNNPEVLKVVAAHPRWHKNYTVRLAIVRNPYSPTYVSLRLAIFLLPKDLIEISEDTRLHPVLRKFCLMLLKKGGN